MKHVVLASILFLLPSFTFATSGACSGHSGVDCSAGRDRDGSVICYDGWRNSSVHYSSMVKCSGYDEPEPVTTQVPESVRPVSAPIIKPIVKTVSEEPKTVQIAPMPVQPIKKVEIVETGVESEQKIEVAPSTQQTRPSQPRVGFWTRIFNLIF